MTISVKDHVYDEYTSPTSISGDPVFFQDDKTYWSPASNTRGLYKQLSSKKYREIVKQDIRYVAIIGIVHNMDHG